MLSMPTMPDVDLMSMPESIVGEEVPTGPVFTIETDPCPGLTKKKCRKNEVCDFDADTCYNIYPVLEEITSGPKAPSVSPTASPSYHPTVWPTYFPSSGPAAQSDLTPFPTSGTRKLDQMSLSGEEGDMMFEPSDFAWEDESKEEDEEEGAPIAEERYYKVELSSL